MRSMGIVISLLLVCAGLALGLPSWANGHRGMAVGIATLCVLCLALTVAAYGPRSARFHARWQPLKGGLKRLVILGLPIFGMANALGEAYFALSNHACTVIDGKRHALIRWLFREICDQYGYQAFAFANLALVPLFAWLWLLLRRARADQPE